jgi:uncharacterized integral membrane protein
MREDIFFGIKNAIFKGESLKQAMMSFYRAGYKKEEIEEAARAYQAEKRLEGMQRTYQENNEIKKQKQMPDKKNTQKISSYGEENKNIPIQETNNQGQYIEKKNSVSDYSDNSMVNTNKKSKLAWIILISGGLIIILGVILILIFREQVMNFVNNLMD